MCKCAQAIYSKYDNLGYSLGKLSSFPKQFPSGTQAVYKLVHHLDTYVHKRVSKLRTAYFCAVSQAIVSQVTGNEPVYLFSQEHNAPIFKGCTGEPKQSKVTHAYVRTQFTDTHSEQEFQGQTEECDNKSQESMQDHTEQVGDRFQESVQGHNIDKIPVSVSNPQMHMQLPPPLLQELPSDQTMATLRDPPAGGQTFLVQSMTELLKAQT